jgi:hypothetical protein
MTESARSPGSHCTLACQRERINVRSSSGWVATQSASHSRAAPVAQAERQRSPTAEDAVPRCHVSAFFESLNVRLEVIGTPTEFAGIFSRSVLFSHLSAA